MPVVLRRSKRVVAVAVAVAVTSVSVVVLLSAQSTVARAAVAPGSTVRASVVTGDAAAQSPRGGDDQELAADGTAVAFTSFGDLDDLDTSGEVNNVYVRDLRNGRTVLISRGQLVREVPPPPTGGGDGGIGLHGKPVLSLNGAQPSIEFREVPANGNSNNPTISADGRYVAFTTNADNILPEDDDARGDVLVCDRDPDGDGVFDEDRENGDRDYEYFRVNEPRWNEGSEGDSRAEYVSNPKLSDDASRIVWQDEEYIPGSDGSFGTYRRTVRTAVLRVPGGAVLEPAVTEVVATPLDGAYGPTAQSYPDVSSDGRYIVLVADYERSEGSGEFPTMVPFQAVLRKDTETQAVLRVDWDVNTTPDHVEYLSSNESTSLYSPSMSGNGGEIAFVAEENQDTCPDDGGCWYPTDQPMVFVVRIGSDAAPVDSIVASRDNENEIVNGFHPALSGDGRFLAFGTDNVNAHDGVDRATGNYSCVNSGGEGFASKPMLNLSGLPPTSEGRDERTVCQIVVRDLVVDRDRLRAEQPRLPGTLASPGTSRNCAETVPDGATCAGNDDSPPYTYSTAPSLSHNGSTIAFDSNATDLVPGVVDDNDRTDVFVRTFQPQLRADPTPLDFGEVEIDDTFDKTVRFDHVGTGPLVVTDITVTDGDFTVGAQTCAGEGVVLQQTDSCEISVTFEPTAEGARTGTLVVRLRDGREFTVPLQGIGSATPVPPDDARFAATPDPLAFGDRLLLADTPTQTVTVTNTGGLPLTITEITIVSVLAPNDYAVAADTCTNVPVAPAATCQVTIRFAPVEPLARAAVLRFVDNASGGPHLIGLTGNGSTPAVSVSPAVTQPGRVITVTGTGFAPNRAVSITMAESVEKAVAVTDDTGTFRQSLLILPKSSIGNRAVVATVDTFPTITAQKPLLIVTPSVGPADFVLRG